MKSALLLFSLSLCLMHMGFSCCHDPDNPDCPGTCPDPTNPVCDDYNPCYPDECEPKGTLKIDRVFSEGLVSNLLNDNPERNVSIYLPPGYETETEKYYPVLYLLHGFTGDHDTFFGGQASELYGPLGNRGINIKRALDTLIQYKQIKPLIVVCPGSCNSYEGSWYTNSIVTGNWEDFVVQDVVSYMDSNYRTLPKAESRGIAGHSMGAYGAMMLAMKHPDIFSSVYAMGGSGLSIGTMIEAFKDEIIAAHQESSYSLFADTRVRIAISMAVALAPNPEMDPFMGEFPYDENGTRIDSSWEKWMSHDPLSLLGDYSENMNQLAAIRLDCGNGDDANLMNQLFSDALTSKGIDHVYEIYSGNHTDMIPERMGARVFPFFSKYLDN